MRSTSLKEEEKEKQSGKRGKYQLLSDTQKDCEGGHGNY